MQENKSHIDAGMGYHYPIVISDRADDGRDHDDFPVFDERDFDTAGLDIPADLLDPTHVLSRLNHPRIMNIAQGVAATHENAVHTQKGLFGDDVEVVSPQMIGLMPRRTTELWEIVARAYADVRIDRSTDYVVVEPEANILFLQRCWQLGARATQFELNWILMNARKAGRLSQLPRAAPCSLPKDSTDEFIFASDIAMRLVRDRVYHEGQRDISIDNILCDPKLISEFDRICQTVAPGFSTFQYRWGAISLRKARRSRPVDGVCIPRLDDNGFVEDVRKSRLPTGAGFYWVKTSTASLFMGVANDLQTQVDALVGRLTLGTVREILGAPETHKARLFLTTDVTAASEVVRTAMLRREGSRLNYMQKSMFENAA